MTISNNTPFNMSIVGIMNLELKLGAINSQTTSYWFQPE